MAKKTAQFLARTYITLSGMNISHSKPRWLHQPVEPGGRGNSELKCVGTPVSPLLTLLLGSKVSVLYRQSHLLVSGQCPLPRAAFAQPKAAGGGTHAADPRTQHHVLQLMMSPEWERAPQPSLCIWTAG